VQRAINAAVDYKHIINPVYSFNCDYQNVYYFGIDTYQTATVNSGWNACDTTNWITSQWGKDPVPTWCSQPNCNGCTDNSGNICFHPTCQNDILNQMNLMANASGGQLLNLANITNLNIDVEKIIEKNVEQYKLEVGERKNQTRYVVEIEVPTPNNLYIDVRLWVYTNSLVNFTSLED